MSKVSLALLSLTAGTSCWAFGPMSLSSSSSSSSSALSSLSLSSSADYISRNSGPVIVDRWEEVQKRIHVADEGDVGAPPNLYWLGDMRSNSSSQRQGVFLAAKNNAKAKAIISAKGSNAAGCEDRWDTVQERIFMADSGDVGALPNLYWGANRPATRDSAFHFKESATTWVDRWDAVQHHIFLADQGDPGALPNLYWGGCAPRSVGLQKYMVDPAMTAWQGRWDAVQTHIFLADEGDCGPPPNLYWREQNNSNLMKSSSPALKAAWEGTPLPTSKLSEPAISERVAAAA